MLGSRIERQSLQPVSRPGGVLRVRLEPGRLGRQNMARDAALLAAQTAGLPPVLRLYTWSPPAISVGYMQDADAVVDSARCRADGIDVVKRPTGGRAILHADEITYAVVAACGDACFGRSLHDAHQIIGECLAAGLRQLGVHATLSRPDRDTGRSLVREPCFASAGRAEVLVHGRKLVGSAQRRTAAAFLQHGSLLLGPAHENLVDYMQRSDATAREVTRAKLRRSTITLHEILGRSPTFAQLAQALVHGFADRLGLVPSVDEAALVDQA